MILRYLVRSQIDDAKWDAAIHNAINGMPYAYAWYLDITSGGHWAAIVSDDYTFVMPLPWNKKVLGLSQVYQPSFSQQLGIFGKEKIDDDIINQFIKHIPTHFRFVSFSMTESLVWPQSLGISRLKTNMILSLDRPYIEIADCYGRSLKKRVEKTQKKLRFEINKCSAAACVAFYKSNIGHKVGLTHDEYLVIKRLIVQSIERSKGVIYAAYDDEGLLLASIFFLKSHGRLIQLFGSSSIEGRKLYASHFLLDSVIRSNSEQPFLLDFEGSELPGVKEFFQSFGPEEMKYNHITIDRLPWMIRQLKRLAHYLRG